LSRNTQKYPRNLHQSLTLKNAEATTKKLWNNKEDEIWDKL